MLVKFKYDMDDYHISVTKEMQSNVSEKDIITMYEKVMPMRYSKYYSSYEIIKEGD